MGKELGSDYYNDIFKNSKIYSKNAEDIDSYYTNWKITYDFIIKNKIKYINDLGCGPGHFPTIFEENEKINYNGYDFSQTAIDQANSKKYKGGNNINFYVRDLSTDISDITNFDFFVSFEFLEHISFDLDLLSNLKRGSQIIFSVPSYDSVGHVRFFTKEEEVIRRYNIFLDLTLLNIKKIKNSKIYLYHGIKK